MDDRMLSRLKVAFISVVIISSVALLVQDSSGEGSVEDYLASQGFESDNMSGYEITESRERTIGGVKITEIDAENNGEKVRIEVLSDVSDVFAENYIDDRRNAVVSMYTDTPSPYDAVPEREVDCSTRLEPDITTETAPERVYYEMYADEELSLGVCSDERAVYRVDMVNLYCPGQKRVLEIAVFSPESDASQTSPIETVRCKN